MMQALKIIIVLSACHYMAFFILSRLTPFKKELQQYLTISVITISAMMILRHPILGYIVTIFALTHYSRNQPPEQKICLFFSQAFTLTFSAGFDLNPGINLGALSYPRILILTLLLPLVLAGRKDKAIMKFNTLDKVALFYFIWICLVNMRTLGESVTAVLRADLYTYIDFIVPYLAVRFYTKNYALLMAAIAFALLSQVITGTVEAFLHWLIHIDIQHIAGFSEQIGAMYKVRFGLLRVTASLMNPLIYALFANMGFLVALIYLMRIGMDDPPKTFKKWVPWLGMAFGTLGTIASGSRAGMAGSILMVLVFAVVLWAIKRKADPKRMLITLGLTAVTLFFILGEGFLRQNFAYRVMLFETSMPVIAASPITGVNDPANHPDMQTMVQGEGIVDIVNTYLMIALGYGLPALFAFVYVLFSGLSRLYSSMRQTDANDIKLPLGVFCIASLVVIAFNMTTTSAFGWTPLWTWLMFALGSNLVERTKAEHKEKLKKQKALSS